jgi:hypothetical protein
MQREPPASVVNERKSSSSFPGGRPAPEPLEDTREKVSLPAHLFGKLIDFLEDRSGSRVVRRKNAFYCVARPDRPIAWLNSKDTLTIVVRGDSTLGAKRNAIQLRIQDIRLPEDIRVEYATYQSLLCQLVRSSRGGVTRWFNKFYSSETGNVLAELISSEKIKIFETQGLFVVSWEVELEKKYAPIELPQEQYLRLLNFLEQESGGGEVARIGNAFYPKEKAMLLRSALKSPATIGRDTAGLLETGALAELVSQEIVRLRDGTSKSISGLVLKNRVFRRHLYFCQSCQSFVRLPFRATTHGGTESEKHSMTYVSSHLLVVPELKRRAPKEGKIHKRFPQILYRFWGIGEKGRVVDKRKISRRKQSSSIVGIPTVTPAPAIFTVRPVPTTTLLLAADISVDGHTVTIEEKIGALQTLDNGEVEKVVEE